MKQYQATLAASRRETRIKEVDSSIKATKESNMTPAASRRGSRNKENSIVDVEVKRKKKTLVKTLFSLVFSDLGISLFLLTISIVLKLPNLCTDRKPIWDETHFGNFMSSYLKREYFFDVHPPIGRLLIALAGWILKLDPSFDYKTGESFPPNYNYCSLRIYHTIFSGLSSPAAYLSVRNLGLPKLLSLIAGLFIALEHGIAFFTRIIILDSFLLSFVSIAYCFMLATENAFNKWPFSRKWKLLAFCTGVFMGISCGIKYSGVFTAIPICVMVIEALWNRYKNISFPIKDTIKLFLYYAVTLIILPGIVLLLGYLTHLNVLTTINQTSAGLLSEYIYHVQSSNVTYDANLLYGSLFTFNTFNKETSNLHSHKNKYPGTNYFQVTCYSFVDENNQIELLPPEFAFYSRNSFLQINLVVKRNTVKNGDLVILRHNATNGYFGVFGEPSSVTRSEYRVESEYEGDITERNSGPVSLESLTHAIWEIRDARLDPSSREPIKMGDSKIIFINISKNCLLRMTEYDLAYWGVNQHEVTCRPYYIKTNSGTIWYAVDQISPSKSPTTDKVKSKKPNVLRIIFYLIKSTITRNSSLVPKAECNSSIDTAPLSWSYNYNINIAYNLPDNNGMNGNVGSYNPIILISSTASYVITVLCHWYLSLKKKLVTKAGKSLHPDTEWFLSTTRKTLLVYISNYLPYFLMRRQRIVHHYIVPYYFSIINAFVLYHLLSLYLNKKTRNTLFILILLPLTAYFIKNWNTLLWGGSLYM